MSTESGTRLTGRDRVGELARFSAIGLVNTASYFVLFLLLHLMLPYLPAHVLAFAGAMTGSFFLNCAFTFRVRPTWGRFARFPLVNLGTFLLMTAGVAALVEFAGWAADPAALVSALAAVPLSFIVARLVLLGSLRDHGSGS